MMFFLLLIVGFVAGEVAGDCTAVFEEVEEDGSVVNIIPFKSGCKGSITSPGFPSNYLSSTHIEWRVRSNESGVTVIQVKSLRLEPRMDVVKIIEDHEGTLSTTSLYSKIDSYGRLVPAELTFYRSHTNPELRVVFESDAEVDAAGFNISYAFNDCVALDDIEHGVLQEVLSEGEVRYKIQCDQVSGDCTEHHILNGRLEKVHERHYKVICDCKLCSVIGPTTLVCVEHDGRMIWEGLQEVHGAEYPQCVANTCATPQASDTTLVIMTSSSRVPGSYYKERCIAEIIPDVTRWCLSTGQWTEGFAEGQCS